MVLYAADLIDFEKPKPISKEPEVEKVEKVVKPKKEMSEKQKASLLKAQETRRLKKEAAEQEKIESEALAQKLQDAALKKPRKKVKVEAVAEVKVEEVKPVKVKKEKTVKVAEPVSEVEEPKKRKRELKPKSNDPPEWFKKYVEGVQKEKAATGGDVSKKQETIIKNEALKVAQKSWDSGFTRDRVQNEVDSHMNRMYIKIKIGTR